MSDLENAVPPAQHVLPSTFGAKLNELFDAVHPPGRKPYTNPEVAAAISQGEVKVSGQYLWMLRTGRRTNPTHRVVDALAAFFGVPSAYFYNDAPIDELAPRVPLLDNRQEAEVRQIAHRARGLSPGALRAVLAMVEHARELEGLADGSGGDAGPS